MPTVDDITFSDFREEDVDDVMDLLAKDLYPREPMSVAFQLSFEEDKECILKGIPEWIKSGVSVVARSQEDGKLVGFVLSSLQRRGEGNSFQEAITHVNLKIKALYSLLYFMEEEVDFFEMYDELEHIVRLEMLSVSKEFCGRRIGQRLIKESEARAVKLDCQLIATQATSVASQQAFLKLGYEVFYTLDYATFEFSGKSFFNIERSLGTTCAKVMARTIQEKIC